MAALLAVLTGCGKKTEYIPALKENQYRLTALDGNEIVVTVPEDFTIENQEDKTSVLKAFYRKSATKPLELYYFKESDQYSVKDIEKEMEKLPVQYEELVALNDGRVLSKTEEKNLQAGKLTGKYTEVKYQLDDTESYNAEFYLQEGDYVIQGSLRLDGEDSDKVQIEELAECLVQEKTE